MNKKYIIFGATGATGSALTRQLYEDTTFGFNAQQGEWPGTIWKDITDFGSDVKTGAENVYTAGENLVTGSDKPMGLLSDDLMANMSTTPDKLIGGPETLAELGINPTGISHLIILQETIHNLEVGWEIGIFDQEGIINNGNSKCTISCWYWLYYSIRFKG